MGDTIIVRGDRPLQTVQRQSAQPIMQEQSTVSLSEGDFAQLRQIWAQIEQLKQQASFNSSWRQEAETDYLCTRKRLMENENRSSHAVAAANEIGQLSNSLGSQIAWLEINLAQRSHHLGEIDNRVSAMKHLMGSVDEALNKLTERMTILESSNISTEVVVLQKRISELEEKLAKEKGRRTQLAEDCNSRYQSQLLKVGVLEQAFLAADGAYKEAVKTIVSLGEEIKQLKENDRNKDEQLRNLFDEINSIKLSSAATMQKIFENNSSGSEDKRLENQPKSPTPRSPTQADKPVNSGEVKYQNLSPAHRTLTPQPNHPVAGANGKKITETNKEVNKQNTPSPNSKSANTNKQGKESGKPSSIPQTSVKTWTQIAADGIQKWQEVNRHGKPIKLADNRVKIFPGGLPKDSRRLVFLRDEKMTPPKNSERRVVSEINTALSRAGVPVAVRFIDVFRSGARSITLILSDRVCAVDVLKNHHNLLLNSARRIDRGIQKVDEGSQWIKVKLNGIPIKEYFGKGTGGMQRLQTELLAENSDQIGFLPRWVGSFANLQKSKYGTEMVTVLVKGEEAAERVCKMGMRAAGKLYRTERWIVSGPGTLCSICSQWGHAALKCPSPNSPRCTYCAGNHRTSQHQCDILGCHANSLLGEKCGHLKPKCPLCKINRGHTADDKVQCHFAGKAVFEAREHRKTNRQKVRESISRARESISVTPSDIEGQIEGENARVPPATESSDDNVSADVEAPSNN